MAFKSNEVQRIKIEFPVFYESINIADKIVNSPPADQAAPLSFLLFNAIKDKNSYTILAASSAVISATS